MSRDPKFVIGQYCMVADQARQDRVGIIRDRCCFLVRGDTREPQQYSWGYCIEIYGVVQAIEEYDLISMQDWFGRSCDEKKEHE